MQQEQGQAQEEVMEKVPRPPVWPLTPFTLSVWRKGKKKKREVIDDGGVLILYLRRGMWGREEGLESAQRLVNLPEMMSCFGCRCRR